MVQHTFFALLACAASAVALNVQRITSDRTVSQNDVLPQASFVSTLSHKVPRRAKKTRALRQLQRGRSQTASLSGAAGDQEYVTEITIGDQKFQAIVDTGSSDTWLANKGYKCFDLSDNPVPEAACDFGTPVFDKTKSKTFEAFKNMNFNISYGDNEFLTGDIGFETVTVGGLTVTHQEIGLATAAAWEGDNVTAGLLGLAYPGLTDAYKGTDPDADGSANNVVYNPFFFNAVEQKSVAAPYFSIALNRGTFAAETNATFDPNLGYLAFGGIAPVPVTSTAVTVPVQGFATKRNVTTLFYYTVDIDSYIFTGSTKVNTTGSAILDTGTTLNYLPSEVAKAYNAKFVPPARFDEDEGLYLVDCNAKVPAFSAVIGGKTFVVDTRDNILPNPGAEGSFKCISGTQDGGEVADGSIFILGDVFLHNVVSTFDISNNTVTIHERTRY
ncbi:acid protease [Trametopsis cervina]|nr:acid protease [Trametopsis cervina]